MFELIFLAKMLTVDLGVIQDLRMTKIKGTTESEYAAVLECKETEKNIKPTCTVTPSYVPTFAYLGSKAL